VRSTLRDCANKSKYEKQWWRWNKVFNENVNHL
jgi:hypothetical protein